MRKGRRIEFDDDVVIVYKGQDVIYHGIEDFEPMKDEAWTFNEKDGAYHLPIIEKHFNSEYIKICF